MKIALVSLDASPLTADVDSRGLRVAELAAALSRQRHEVNVYAGHSDPALPEQATANGYAVTHLPSNPAEFVDELVAQWQWGKPDVVHSLSSSSSLVSSLSARQAEVTVVQTAHESGEQLTSDEYALYRSAGGVIATTGRKAAALISAGVRRSRICVVPPGVDTELFQPDGSDAPRVPPHRVAWLGEPLPGNGSGVADLIPDTEFATVGGSGPARSARSRAALLRSADVAVCTGLSAEQESLTLEAMSCGVPVVEFLPGGPSDMMVHGITGLHVRQGDVLRLIRTLRALLAAPTQRELLGILARDRVCVRYSWDRIATDVIHSYDEALGSHLVPQTGGRTR
ncbi:Glycosyltransferase involved in cell wall bisynthesis [Lentzea waywayandensis]|uniref:Glycosyltransferase involved in cell wall bisynthesis n=1 Tax=Lentzea waywayandensis TaxID=84724 RepID=A0A1I6FDA5_9PSEU|nr:glycosyltransferase [Lentzea waywayandensis]SFR27898.1 Glycosyltransferase involved in cell wall bisynthesis [Lentzea waywayandensis]